MAESIPLTREYLDKEYAKFVQEVEQEQQYFQELFGRGPENDDYHRQREGPGLVDRIKFACSPASWYKKN